MKEPKVKANKAIFGPCRLSYTHVLKKYKFDDKDGDGKYMTNILIPKSETATIDAINQAVEAAKADGQAKWKGTKKPLDLPLKDGDQKDDPIYSGHFYLNAKTNNRPGVVNAKGEPITDEDEMYSGVWAYCSVTFYPFAVSGNVGVGCALNNLMKFKDDERLGGGASAATDFEGFGEDDDDL